MDDVLGSLKVSAAGMRSQGTRIRVVAENIANADSTPTEPGQDPYRRRVVSFKSVLDAESGQRLVQVNAIDRDMSRLPQKYEPGNPAADARGYVTRPNVEPLIEMTDLREAERSYEANLNVIKVAKGLLNDTIDILR